MSTADRLITAAPTNLVQESLPQYVGLGHFCRPVPGMDDLARAIAAAVSVSVLGIEMRGAEHWHL
jgi:hypothetical protein